MFDLLTALLTFELLTQTTYLMQQTKKIDEFA